MTGAAPRLELVVERGGGERRCDAVLRDGQAELGDGDSVPARVLATRLAAEIGLGPRDRREVPELIVVERDLLERHLAGRQRVDAATARGRLALPAEAPDDLAESLGELPEAFAGRWRVSPVGGDGAPPPLEALDGGPTGWWQVLAGDGSGVALAASSGRLLWTQLALTTAWLTQQGESAA